MAVDQDLWRVQDWVADGSRWTLQWTADNTPLLADNWIGPLSALITAAAMAGLMFFLTLNTMLVLLWIERKLLGRLMDRRGAVTAMRSLWVGESGTRPRWWLGLPFGLGRPIGFLIDGLLFRLWGNRHRTVTATRVNDRSYMPAEPFGIPLLPGFFQNIADGMKLFTKEWMVPARADKLAFEVAPVIITASTILIFVFIPHSSGLYANDSAFNVLFMMAVFGIAPLGVFFAGWSSNNKYTLIGGIRSAAQLTAYEIPLLLVVLSVCVAAGTFNLREIVQFQMDTGAWLFAMMPLGFLLFIVTMVAEVERIPFDMPEAEAELVEGWWTEYGGGRWMMMFMSEYLRVYAACLLAAIFFFGGWAVPFEGFLVGTLNLTWIDEFWGPFWTWTKSWVLFGLFVWLRAALPRVRTDQILEFGWRWLLPLSMLNLVFAVLIRVYWFDGEGWSWGIAPGTGLGDFIDAAIPWIILIVLSGVMLAMAWKDDNHLPDRREGPMRAVKAEPVTE